jgi:hypothetical protein
MFSSCQGVVKLRYIVLRCVVGACRGKRRETRDKREERREKREERREKREERRRKRQYLVAGDDDLVVLGHGLQHLELGHLKFVLTLHL